MNSDELKEMHRLCTLMQSEQNPKTFSLLLEQLNDLLERNEVRLIEKLRSAGSTLRTSGAQAA